MITCMACGAQLNVIKHTHLRYKCTGEYQNVAEYRQKFPTAKTMDDDVRGQLANTLENFIRRHGQEDGQRKWDEYREKQRRNGNTLEYFIEKYGDHDGVVEYHRVCKLKGNSLENMIRIHGQEKGVAKYENWLEKTTPNRVSLVGSQFVKDMAHSLPDDFIFYDGVSSKEFCIWNERVMLYDFVVTEPYKKAIEFNGDFWHANPKFYKETDILKHRGGTKTAAEIWQKDRIKIDALKARGFDVKIVWENEYMNDRESVIRECIEWILKE